MMHLPGVSLGSDTRLLFVVLSPLLSKALCKVVVVCCTATCAAPCSAALFPFMPALVSETSPLYIIPCAMYTSVVAHGVGSLSLRLHIVVLITENFHARLSA
jgi:hypothetical protein